MTALAVERAVCTVAAVATGRGALWRRSSFARLLMMESPAAAEDDPAQFKIEFSSG
jgi:hypothetical protein